MKRSTTTLVLSAALLLTGCSAADTVGNEASSASPSPANTAAEASIPTATSPAATTPAPGNVHALNDRGNMDTTVGQERRPFDPNSAVEVGAFTVTGISPSVCTEETSPENGKFLTVKMNVEAATAEWNPDGLPFYANSGGGVLTIIKSDGTMWGGVPTTAECLPSADTLPAAAGVGEKHTGAMVLDVPADAAVLIYKPTLGMGYEYKLP